MVSHLLKAEYGRYMVLKVTCFKGISPFSLFESIERVKLNYRIENIPIIYTLAFNHCLTNTNTS